MLTVFCFYNRRAHYGCRDDVDEMDEAVIIQALEQAFEGLNLHFQVIYQQETLYVCIDREAEQILECDTLTETCRDAVALLIPSETRAIMLLSRIVGQTEPDWQTVTALTQPQADELSPDCESGHGAETSSEQPLSLDAQALNSETAEAENELLEVNAAVTDFSQYCFVRNKALVTAEVLPPEANIAELVRAFHELSDTDKQSLLPHLEQIIKTQMPSNFGQDSEAITHFCGLLTALSGSEMRKAAIWLSRYCYDPEATLAQITAQLNPSSTAGTSSESHALEPAADDPLQHSIASVPVRRERAYTPSTYAPSSSNSHSRSKRKQKTAPKITWQFLLIPVTWTLFTLSIVVFNVQANNGPGAVERLCKSVKDAPEYCRLAVQLVGPETFETYSHQTQPAAENVASTALQDCALKGALNAGGNLIDLMKDENRRKSAPKNVVQKEVLPGLFVSDLTQASLKDRVSPVRTACVSGMLRSKISQTQKPLTLADHVIPTQWPQEPLKSKPHTLKMADAQSVHGLLSLLGTNTLFAAVGLLLVTYLRLGIRLESFGSLYLAAFVFGIVDLMLCSIPMIGTFGIIRFTAVPVVGLVITSQFVKGLQVELSEGYKVLALGGGIIVGVRYLLNLLMLSALLSFM